MEQGSQSHDIEMMANAAEFISQGEVFNEALRSDQDWSLLPDIGLCSSIAPCLLIQGHSNYPGFPQWLGKNSTATKIKRMVRELKAAMGHNA
jgi:replication factor C subunit 1